MECVDEASRCCVQTNAEGPDDLAQRDSVVRQILHLLRKTLIGGAIQIRGALAKNLVNSEPNLLTTVFRNLINRPDAEVCEDLLAATMDCMFQICFSQWAEPSIGGSDRIQIRGGSILADEFLEALLGCIPNIRSYPFLVQRNCSRLLVVLVLVHRESVDRLLACDELCKYLFFDYMVSCGDFHIQVYIMRILLRCGHKNAELYERFVLSGEVRARLHQMKGCEPTSQELRPVILALNKSQARPSVSSLEAVSIDFESAQVVPSKWIDVGKYALTFHFQLAQEPWRKEDFLSIETHSLERAYIDKEEAGLIVVITLEAVLGNGGIWGAQRMSNVIKQQDSRFCITIRARSDVAAPLLQHLAVVFNMPSRGDEAPASVQAPAASPSADTLTLEGPPSQAAAAAAAVVAAAEPPRAEGAPTAQDPALPALPAPALQSFPLAQAEGATVRGVKRARGADEDGPESARDPIKRIKMSELAAIVASSAFVGAAAGVVFTLLNM